MFEPVTFFLPAIGLNDKDPCGDQPPGPTSQLIISYSSRPISPETIVDKGLQAVARARSSSAGLSRFNPNNLLDRQRNIG
jgi:hypothetical protein